MRIACIGNYPPRECGIATFTRDFINSLIENDGEGSDGDNDVFVIAMNDQDKRYAYPDIVAREINQNRPQDYLEAVNYINFRKPHICFLQHEFGIFGGNSGVFILPLIHRLKVPLIPVFHTILRLPSYNERNIMMEIGKRAAKIIVMNSLAVEILKTVYGIPEDKVAVVPHGVPQFDFTQNLYHKKQFNVTDKKLLLTFGLLSRSKGLETVIEALPRVVEKHPDLIYIILGKTHPAVKRSSGEEYRNFLKLLIRRHNLTNHVFFEDRFIETDELLGYLSASDVYVTPYLNEEQITSGTLAYAVGAGNAVVSTPYWHARELLAHDRGILFGFKDSHGLADIILDLLDNPDKLKRLRQRAFDEGIRMSWPKVGKQILDVSRSALDSFEIMEDTVDNEIKPLLLPKFSLEHIKRITDHTGILQHAKYNIPNYRDGYCLDDNARALLMTVMAFQQYRKKETLKLMSRYLSYIQYMQRADGGFHNFLSYSREFLDEQGSSDAIGRTIWALGYLVRYAPSESYFELGGELFKNAFDKIDELSSLRGIANALIGLTHWVNRFAGDEGAVTLLCKLVKKIQDRFYDHNSENWHWYEPALTYDNGIIPYSLLCAYGITSDEETLEIATHTLDFLESHVYRKDCDSLSLIGTDHWFVKGSTPASYDQQPLDAMAMILMYYQAYMAKKNKKYLHKLYSSFMWFLGENDLRMPLYDYETKGCNDGLKLYGVNRNQGAESSLAYLISYLTVMSCYPLSL